MFWITILFSTYKHQVWTNMSGGNNIERRQIEVSQYRTRGINGRWVLPIHNTYHPLRTCGIYGYYIAHQVMDIYCPLSGFALTVLVGLALSRAWNLVGMMCFFSCVHLWSAGVVGFLWIGHRLTDSFRWRRGFSARLCAIPLTQYGWCYAAASFILFLACHMLSLVARSLFGVRSSGRSIVNIFKRMYILYTCT